MPSRLRGKSLSTETVSTIGEQRGSNYALADMGVEEFLDVVTEGQPAAPGYFVHDAILNRKDRDLLSEGELPEGLDLDSVIAARDRGALLVDTRDQSAFSGGHLSGSVNIALDGRFAEYAGSVARPGDELVLTVRTNAEPDK